MYWLVNAWTISFSSGYLYLEQFRVKYFHRWMTKMVYEKYLKEVEKFSVKIWNLIKRNIKVLKINGYHQEEFLFLLLSHYVLFWWDSLWATIMPCLGPHISSWSLVSNSTINLEVREFLLKELVMWAEMTTELIFMFVSLDPCNIQWNKCYSPIFLRCRKRSLKTVKWLVQRHMSRKLWICN